jgi:aminopeptidase N
LSNGNPAGEETLPTGASSPTGTTPSRSRATCSPWSPATWRPVEDRFTTQSGREVPLNIYVEPENLDKCDHAMASLKAAMRWDEERYGREYDLDVFNIVAVSHFNMGAMENKGLNVFNAKYILARPRHATDADFAGIEGVVAHEYFHNWTGNRITCRDWFQLSLKEGFTVYRDQEFSADMGSRGVKRIEDVRMLRARQFAEDAGPWRTRCARIPTSRSTTSTPPPSTRRAPRWCACRPTCSAPSASAPAPTSISSASTARP